MDVRAVVGDIATQEVDAVVVNLFQGVQSPGGGTGAVDKALDGAISGLIADGEIKGKKGELTLIHTLGKISPKRVLVVGLGKQGSLTLEAVGDVAAESARYLRKIGVKRAASIVHGAGTGGLDAGAAAQAMTEGALLGLYTFKQLKSSSSDDEGGPQELLLVEQESDKLPALEEGVRVGSILAEAASLARTLGNEPANRMTPTRLAEIAGDVARDADLEITVFDEDQCREMGMNAYLGVARGSNEPPKFIVLSYKGDPDNPENNLGIVGKGITFDSGGISLKPAAGMGAMKGDMSGASSAIGSMLAIGRLKPRINVTAIVAATENMPSGTATKPGDILRAMNGKTIEVDNTDAEGRVTLADAITYAKQIGLVRLVDIATLTGAIRTALGDLRLGLFTNNQDWADQVLRASEAAGERMWQLPMDEEYKELNHSDWADVKNTGGPSAGSITAAHFIGVFAEDTPWVHLDIAGVARLPKNRGLYVTGHTGIPVRSLVRLALDLAG